MNIEQFILANEPVIRLGFFLGIFAVIGIWEVRAPRRALSVSKALRWAGNLGLVALNTVILRLVFPLAAVVIFEVLLDATAMFNHGNLRLPAALDRVLRRVVVTPDMHRTHHSIEDDETNSNFGFNLPWWDRLFGTYRVAPRGGHEGMTLGIRDFRNLREVARLAGMLWLPFKGEIKDYAINRRNYSAEATQ